MQKKGLENPATKLRIKIEDIAARIKESYNELNEIYNQICKIEEAIENRED